MAGRIIGDGESGMVGLRPSACPANNEWDSYGRTWVLIRKVSHVCVTLGVRTEGEWTGREGAQKGVGVGKGHDSDHGRHRLEMNGCCQLLQLPPRDRPAGGGEGEGDIRALLGSLITYTAPGPITTHKSAEQD